jgi:hypothetical protein
MQFDVPANAIADYAIETDDVHRNAQRSRFGALKTVRSVDAQTSLANALLEFIV